MGMNRILRLLFGLLLLMAGLSTPFIARSHSADWSPQRTLIRNALASHITLLPDTRKTRFQVVRPGEENRSAYLVQFEETQLFLEFDPALGTLEIQRIIKSHFPDNHIPPGDPVQGRIRFEGWAGHPARSVPFGWSLAVGLVFLVGGGLLAGSAASTPKG